MSSSIGPSLPPGFATEGYSDEEASDNVIGPFPPPPLTREVAPQQIGPQMGPQPNAGGDGKTYGPALPPGPEFNTSFTPSASESEEESDGEMIGPMPSTANPKVIDTSA